MAENYISTNMNTGVDVKTALERISEYQPDLFAWTEISDSVTVNLKSPTTYSGIKDPGDYVIYKFSNGPSAIPSTLSPILLSLRNGNVCVTANSMVYSYDSTSGTWKDLSEDVDDTTVVYIKDNAAPTRTKNTFWFDTSKFDGTKNGYIDLKYYNETSKSWESVFDSAAYLKKSKLDPDNKQLDIFDYIDDKVADAVGDYGDFMKHVDNKLTLIHVSAEDRANYAKIITATELQNLINTTYKTAVKSAIDTSVSTELDTSTLEKNVSTLESDFSNHLKNHVTAAQITAWNNKAEANHTHDYTTGTTKIAASQIVGGTFAADKLPDEIKERYYAGSAKVTDLSTTTVGSTFKFGKYQVESETPWAIEWEIVHQTDTYQIAQTKQIIDLRCFDAKESTNTDSNRKSYGNNVWRYSNIKQFLNSDQATWYSAQHQYDAPPTNANEYTGKNGYDTHKGFLYYFSDEEKSLLKDMTFDLANPTVDGEGSYTWTGKVWLPTYTQMSGKQNNSISEGTKFDKYSDNNSRIKTINKYCVENNKYCIDNSYSEGKAWYYWMSSAIPSASYYARYVYSDGSPERYRNAYRGDFGLAPCICLPKTGSLTTVSPEDEFSNTSITDADRSTKYHNGNAFYYPTTDTYGNLAYRWFRIIDSTKVGTSDWASGVTEFTPTESVLEWSSISGTPTSLADFGITETPYTESEVDEKFSSSKTKSTELEEKVKELDGNSEYEFEATTDASISNIGFQIRKDSSTFSDVKTGSIPQIDAVIRTADNRIYKSTQNLNSTYTDADGNTSTTTNASEPLGASMSEVWLKEYDICNVSSGDYSVGIAKSDSVFVAVGTTVKYSNDGTIWNDCTLPDGLDDYFWSSVTYGDGKFVAVAGLSTNTVNPSAEVSTLYTNVAIYSTDGITWTKTTLPASQKWSSVAYGGSRFVAIGCNISKRTDNVFTDAGNNVSAYSLDGITWAQVSMPSSQNWKKICYGNGKFVATSGATTVAYSTNGTSWTEVTVPDVTYAWNISYALNKFIVVSRYDGIISSSTDGITWSKLEQDYTGIIDLTTNSIPANSSIYNTGTSKDYNVSLMNTCFLSKIIQYNDTTAIGFFAYPNSSGDNDNCCIAKSTDLKSWTLIYNMNGDKTSIFTPMDIICDDDKILTVGGGAVILLVESGILKEVKYSWSTSGSSVALNSDKALPEMKSVNVAGGSGKVSIDTTYSAGDIDLHKDQNGGYVFSGWDKTGEITLTSSSDFRTVVSGIWEWKNYYRYSYSWNASSYSDLKATLPTGDYVPEGSLVTVDKNYTSDSIAEMSIGEWKTSTLPTKPNTTNWRSVCCGGNKIVAIGEPNIAAYRSLRDPTWTKTTLPIEQEWSAVCYGMGMYVAIASNSIVYAYSTDGITWTQGGLPSAENWLSIIYISDLINKFVITSGGNTFLYSSNGIDWNTGTMPGDELWQSLCCGVGRIIAIAYGTNRIAYYSGGDTWFEAEDIPDGVTLMCACYGINFVAIGDSSVLISTDGIHWESNSYTNQSDESWQCVCYGNGKYVALGINGYCLYSTNGSSWRSDVIQEGLLFNSMCYNSSNNEFIGVANEGYYYYGDATSGSVKYLLEDVYNWKSVCYGNSKFIAIASDTDAYAYSTDGITWTQGAMSNIGVTSLSDICYGNGKYVAVTSSKSMVYYSTDGITWKSSTYIKDIQANRICYGNGKYVAFATTDSATSSNIFGYSTDGITWTQGAMPVKAKWYSICYGNGKFVALTSYSSKISAYSTDGITWIQSTMPSTANWMDVCYGNGKFVATANLTNVFAYSTDGITWTQGTMPSTAKWVTVCYGNNRFIAFTTASNIVAYSKDGVNWTQGTMPNAIYSCSACYGISKYAVVTSSTGNGASYYLTPNNQYYSFSGWNKSDFNISADTTISGTWSKKSMLSVAYSWSNAPSDLVARKPETEYFMPNSSVYVDTNYNNKIYKKVTPNWTLGSMPSTANWMDVCYGNGKFVAIVNGSNIFAYSTDGINWTQGTMPSSQCWQSICYGNGKFVVIGCMEYGNYSNIFAYSTDGINWTQGTMPSSRNWRSICYGNGKYIAVTYSTDVFAYSTDGITWTEGTMPSGKRWISVCYGNGKFVAIVNGSNIFAYSTDGINWTSGTMPSSRNWRSICYGNGKFVAIVNGSNIFAYSTDGITWTQGTMPSAEAWYSVCYGNGKFVAIVNGSNIFAYSTDGINWTSGTMPSSRNWRSICYGNGKYIAVTYSTDVFAYLNDSEFNSYYNFSGWNKTGNFNIIEDTTISGTWNKMNPYEWKISNMPSSQSWSSICYGNGKFVAVSNGSSTVAYSTDGVNWTKATLPASQKWSSICYGNGKFVAVANADIFAYSTDGINWTSGTMPSGKRWISVCYGNGKFVAIVNGSNIFAYSTDGINWTSGTMPSSRNWRSICYGNGKFVAIVNGSNIFAYSTDGITWTQGTMPSSQCWQSICYGNGKFVVIGCMEYGNYSNIFAYSTDGINWTQGTMPSYQYWYSVCYGNGKFVAINASSQYVAYSTDGVNWTQGDTNITRELGPICYGNSKFVVIFLADAYSIYSTMGLPEGAIEIN